MDLPSSGVPPLVVGMLLSKAIKSWLNTNNRKPPEQKWRRGFDINPPIGNLLIFGLIAVTGCIEIYLSRWQLQGWFYACALPMRDVVTKWRRLTLAERKPRISPELWCNQLYIFVKITTFLLQCITTDSLNCLNKEMELKFRSLNAKLVLALYKA